MLVAVTVLGCAAADTGTATSTAAGITMRTLATGPYAAAKPDVPQAVAVKSEAEYARMWELVGVGERPSVDFANESAVILLAGSKPSGGYSIEPRGVRLDGNVLVVDAAVKPPPPDAIVTMAFTSPWAVIAVDSKSFETVRWTP